MSEEDRSRLYAWLRDHADESVAEYLMSCLPAAPLPDLVTKQHLEAVLSAEFSTFALSLAAQREADRKEAAAQREADRKEAAAQREADRKEAAVQREADRNEMAAQREADLNEMAVQREADRGSLDRRLRRLAIALPVEIVAALAGVVAVTEWLRA